MKWLYVKTPHPEGVHNCRFLKLMFRNMVFTVELHQQGFPLWGARGRPPPSKSPDPFFFRNRFYRWPPLAPHKKSCEGGGIENLTKGNPASRSKLIIRSPTGCQKNLDTPELRVFCRVKFTGGGECLKSWISPQGIAPTPGKGLKMLLFISSIHLCTRESPQIATFQDPNFFLEFTEGGIPPSPRQ